MLLGILQRQRMIVPVSAVVGMLGAALLAAGGFVLSPTPAAAGGGICHTGSPVSDERTTTVTMSNNCFVATIARVDEGARVTWINEDEAAHMVTGASGSWGMDFGTTTTDPGALNEESELAQDGTLGQGASYSHSFTESGVYPYYCFLHPGMVGAVVVGDGTGDGAMTASVLSAVGAGDPFADEAAGAAASVGSTRDDDDTMPVVIAAAVAGVVALVAGGAAGLAVSRRFRRGDV